MQDGAGLQSTRRQFLKGAVAAGTGVAAAAYVKPSLRALGVPGALAQVSGSPATATPVDSSTTEPNDPSSPSTSFPSLPSTGGGGTSGSFPESTVPAGASDDSRVPELIALAVAGGLIGRRAAQTLRDRSVRNSDSAAQDVASV